jgi:hypothetical protein
VHSSAGQLILKVHFCEEGQAMTEYVILLTAFMMAFVALPELVQIALLRYYEPYALLLSLPIP